MSKKILIIGAGAAGLTSAIFASRNNYQVQILERTNMSGKKILVSGGGRCNILPQAFSYDDYFTSSSKNILKNVFKSWSLEECYKWFTNDIGLKMYIEKESGKYFPQSDSSKEVRDVLLRKAEHLGVKITYDFYVKKIFQEKGQWVCQADNGNRIYADKIIIATGGMSIPKMGTDGAGHRFLKDLGHSINTTYPALTPLKGKHLGDELLAGLSLDIEMSVKVDSKNKKVAKRGGFLFTHKGFSGPSVLDLSHYAVLALEEKKELPEIFINWSTLKEEDWRVFFENAKSNMLVANKLKELIPSRLAIALCKDIGIEDVKLTELKKEKRNELIQKLTRYKLNYTGHEGYQKAEVTGGGVPLEEIDFTSLESKLFKELYLCGEILDVFGRIGGFNFYWAWVSGRLAGLSASK